ncbi:mite group 2 allergen Gly d 2.02-like [Palaemon carinicauda]|uniref:mite group 2 allergen Gly d 2.02-like n=1 Tax=Palaemon carinicauda TaxID=392227 RepID=UPI0035B683D4
MQGVYIILSAVLASAVATQFQDCGSIGIDVVLDVADCPTPPCVLQRGHSYLINFKFTSSVDTDTLTIGASANLGGLEVPWPGIDTDACKGLEGTDSPCPIKAGDFVDWKFEAVVLPEYPKIQTMITFKLIDSNKGYQTCAKLPAVIA